MNRIPGGASYDPRAMRTSLLGLLLAAAGLYGQAGVQAPSPDGLQVQPPVFRGGVYVVPVGLVLAYNRKPWVGLTSADLRVLLDKTELTLLDVVHDESAPNRYTMFFRPPDNARDGKTHVLQVRVRRPNSKNWTTLPFKTALTLPSRQPHSALTF